MKNANVRQAVKAQFLQLAQARLNGELGEVNGKTICAGNKLFRKLVTAYAEENFGVTHASACTAYNYALQYCKTNHPELVVGLGRADDKKGGRKAKVIEATITDAANDVAETVSTEAVEQPIEVPIEVQTTAEPEATEQVAVKASKKSKKSKQVA
jgi:hypothetical protein